MSYPPLTAQSLRWLQQLQQLPCQQLKGLRQQNIQGMLLISVSLLA